MHDTESMQRGLSCSAFICKVSVSSSALYKVSLLSSALYAKRLNVYTFHTKSFYLVRYMQSVLLFTA